MHEAVSFVAWRRISFPHNARQNISHGAAHVSSYDVGEVKASKCPPSWTP